MNQNYGKIFVHLEKKKEAANTSFNWKKFKIYCLCTIHHPVF